MEVDEHASDEVMCRYCFEGGEAGELISPCNCSGGQKFVHLICLRRWQRIVLVSQPNHHAYYTKDMRHHVCNVCQSEFTCLPPTRHELMESFTGPQLAALIDTGSIISVGQVMSLEMEREFQEMAPLARHVSKSHHWIKGVYLITSVKADDSLLGLPIDQDEILNSIRDKLGENLRTTVQGRHLRLIPKGSLEGISEADLPTAFANLRAPATIFLEAEEPSDYGDDHIVAVNLTRQKSAAPNGAEAARLVYEACAKYPRARRVEVTHFLGGPCNEREIACCVVPGGGGCGWTVVPNLTDAIQLAHCRAVRRKSQGSIAGGQAVKLVGLQSRKDLNGEMGLTLRFIESSGRWLVRLPNGEGKQLKPLNLLPLSGSHGQVYAFWGAVRWSRAQLLGEIARGHFGICHASVSDLIVPPEERWDSLNGRLLFAPVTEITENCLREGQGQMDESRAIQDASPQNAQDASQEEEYQMSII